MNGYRLIGCIEHKGNCGWGSRPSMETHVEQLYRSRADKVQRRWKDILLSNK